MPVLAIGALLATQSFKNRDLKIFGTVPEFSLVERSGRNLTLDQLRGKVWIASFIFTHCAEQCPLICRQIQKLQRQLRFKEGVRFVSFSVDPSRDTPEVLARYADRFEADPTKWFFLSGDKKEIDALIQSGFHLVNKEEPLGSFIHSFKLVLVDAFGRVRGYYDAMDEKSITSLIKDTRRLLR